MPFVAPICFDQACQSNADRTFLLVVGAPLLVSAIWLLYLLASAMKKSAEDSKPWPHDSDEVRWWVCIAQKLTSSAWGMFDYDKQWPVASMKNRRWSVFSDQDSESALLYRVLSYTPLPVEDDCQGERIKMDVGKVGDLKPR